MSSPKVSIIMPVFNTERFVEDALSSVMNQTLPEIEIIVINDGSTDNSMRIIQKLALKDNRIQLYTQKNQGLSVTRNRGMAYATGKYIYFMDSDDFLESEAMETCYEKCEKENLDFVFFDADILNKETSFSLDLSYQRKDCTDDSHIYKGIDVLNVLLDHKKYTPVAWLSFIRNSFLREKGLSFYPHIIHEDQLFTCLLYLQAQRVMAIHKDFFKRRLREDSIMTQKFSMKNMKSYFAIADELIKYASLHKETQCTIDKNLSAMLDAAVWLSYRMSFKDRMNIACTCLEKYRKYVTTRNFLVLLFKSFIKK